MNSIKVIIKKPGGRPRLVRLKNELAAFQNAVGGYIECVSLPSGGAVVICNEDGRYLGMDFNVNVCGIGFVGPIVLCGVDGTEFADVPEVWIEGLRTMGRLEEDDEDDQDA